ncbi:MAG: hypothetical protein LC667_19555, partial [Thioalkalivibrio sp.]|nr:hypothetical protein [Thioalkalivibrio sp.]
GGNNTAQERLVAIRRAMAVVDDDPDIWHELGDLIFHYGYRGLSPDPVVEARQAFARAVELDPDFGAPVHHLIELTAIDRDTLALRRYYDAYTRHSGLETSGAVSPGYTAGLALRDIAILSLFQDRLTDVPVGIFGYTAYSAAIAGLPFDRLRRTAHERAAAAATTQDRLAPLVRLWRMEQVAGRTTAFREVLDRMEELGEGTGYPAYQYGILLDGDSADARTRLERRLTAATTAQDSLLWRLMLARGRAAHGDTSGVHALVREATAEPDPPYLQALGYEMDALLAVMEERPTAPEAVQRVDSFASLEVSLGASVRAGGIALTAQLWEELGDVERALAAARRLGLMTETLPHSWLVRARLAARLGHRDEAIRHYRLYLDARRGVEPGTRAARNTEAARDELAALVGAGM